jgi:hypothetical protein
LYSQQQWIKALFLHVPASVCYTYYVFDDGHSDEVRQNLSVVLIFIFLTLRPLSEVP